MNILFSINHPAHFHFFKNTIKTLINKHRIIITARDKEMTVELLKKAGWSFLFHEQMVWKYAF